MTVTALMYDSVTAAAIPGDALIVGGYIDGTYAWPPADWARFPHAVKVRIVVNPRNDAGDVYDCEPGNGFPADAGPWAAMRLAAGHPWPVVYCMRSQFAEVKASCAAAGADGRCGYWVAEWTGAPHPIAGADAVQWADPRFPAAGGRNVDLSTVYAGPWLAAQVSPFKKKAAQRCPSTFSRPA